MPCHRTGLLARALAAGLLLALPAAAGAQTAPAALQDDQRAAAIDLLSRLNAAKLDKTLAAAGRAAPPGLYDCLCRAVPHTSGVGSRYKDGACELAGYGVWQEPLPNDPGAWRACLEQSVYADGLDVVSVLAAVTPAATAAPKTRTAAERLRQAVMRLRGQCLPTARNAEAIIDRYETEVADAAAMAADGLRGPMPRPRDAEVIREAAEALDRTADSPCEQAIELALILEQANVRTVSEYVGALAAGFALPDDAPGVTWEAATWLNAVKKLSLPLFAAGVAIDLKTGIGQEIADQEMHKAVAEGLAEAQQLLRDSRGWDRVGYDATVATYRRDLAQMKAAFEAAAAEPSRQLQAVGGELKARYLDTPEESAQKASHYATLEASRDTLTEELTKLGNAYRLEAARSEIALAYLEVLPQAAPGKRLRWLAHGAAGGGLSGPGSCRRGPATVSGPGGTRRACSGQTGMEARRI